MPLKACPECGQKVAGAAQICPKCSHRLARQPPEPAETSPTWAVPAVVGVALIALGVLAVRSRTDRSDPEPIPPVPAAAPPARVTPPPPPPAEPTPVPPTLRTMWTADWANIRDGRALTDSVVRILTPGQPVEVDSLQGRWWRVHMDGQPVGYVHRTVLLDEAPPPPSDTLTTEGANQQS